MGRRFWVWRPWPGVSVNRRCRSFRSRRSLDAFEAAHAYWVQEANKPPPEPPWTPEDDALPDTLEGQREQVLRKLRERMGVQPDAIEKLREIFGNGRLGQGNPKVTEHPMTRAECRKIRASVETFPPSEVCAGQAHGGAVRTRRRGRPRRTRRCASTSSSFRTSLVSTL